MVRCCCVKGCHKESYAGCGLSFYRVPTDEKRAEQWCKALSKEKIAKSASVCEKHFKHEDFKDYNLYHYKHRRLKETAVPSLCLKPLSVNEKVWVTEKSINGECSSNLCEEENDSVSVKVNASDYDQGRSIDQELLKVEHTNQVDSSDDDYLESLRNKNIMRSESSNSTTNTKLPVCRSCLQTDCELLPINDYITAIYEKLTDIKLRNDMPMSLCAECMAALNKCYEFREKTKQTNRLLEDLLNEDAILNIDKIKQIDRHKHQLTANFRITHYGVEVSDKLLVYDNSIQDKAIAKIISNIDIDKTKILTNADAITNLVTDDAAYIFYDSDEFIDHRFQEDSVNEPETMESDSRAKSIEPGCVKSVLEEIIVNSTKDLKIKANTVTVTEPKECKSFKETKLKEVKAVRKPRRKRGTVKKVPYIHPQLLKKEEDDELLQKFFTIEEFVTLEEQRREFEKRKESISYKRGKFKCEDCFRGFSDEPMYRDHMRTHDASSGAYVCEICSRRVARRCVLNSHRAWHSRRYSCKLCNLTTCGKTTAKKHMNWHEGRTFKCDYAGCGKTYNGVSSIMYHRRMAHPLDHVCGYCGYCFVNEMGLKMHQKRTHNIAKGQQIPEGGPSCKDCDVRFASEEALQKHLRVSFRHGRSERNERVYERVPPTEKRISKKHAPVVCEQCGLQCHNPYQLAYHMKRSHPLLHRQLGSSRRRKLRPDCLCEVCGRAFYCASTLSDHMNIHKQERTFKCSQCSKLFRTSLHLKLHSKRHRGLVFPCDQCPQQFTSKDNRRRHEKTAHLETSTASNCKDCDKIFKNDRTLKQHIRHVHLKEPWPTRSKNRGAVTRRARNLLMSNQGHLAKNQVAASLSDV